MGVPKFFRYISERYPCISEPIRKDSFVCEFDNLYLDMNGIIHMCSHPDDKNPHFRINEEKMYRDIFHYISYLFQLINPRKVFFMAVDGVAPRAKMNQQRSRRFQSAREAEEVLQKAIEKGEVLPEGKQFDSNCITPGTVFMVRLQEQLRYFVKQKMSTDRSWAKCKVILSGHETPGEGEHKIMDYIRNIRSQPNHDPNTRHCLYGLDADLIMLGFCTHEPNFSILREEVLFKMNTPRPSTPDENNFYLLHLSLLRDYIEQEFFSLKTLLPFGFDIDKVIDDWVLMGFLVGNDFVPNLPNMVINKDSLPQLYDIYKKVLPTLGGYMNENGLLNLKRFEIYMANLADLDKMHFKDMQADLRYLAEKAQNKTNRNRKNELDTETQDSLKFDNDLLNLIEATSKFAMDSESDNLISFDDDCEKNDEDSYEDLSNMEFWLHKKEYYINKLKYEEVTKEVLQSQAECYIRGLQWVLHYYYQGCTSWSWFYPHHYAPYLSDVANFSNMDLTFDIGKPFKPFEQLLGVLPINSKELLPEAFHNLMMSEESSIHHYYPLEFETDLNGKLQSWEAVVLIPFINEHDLLTAMEPCYVNLTEDEVLRNTTSPMSMYEYSPEDLGNCHSPAYFPMIDSCNALEELVWVNEILISPDKIIRGKLKNPYSKDFFPGVPTLNHIPFTCEFTKAKVKVFDYPSRNFNAILHVNHNHKEEPSIESLAKRYLGKIVWVGWPYITEAKVKAISNEDFIYEYIPGNMQSHLLEGDQVVEITKKKLEGYNLHKRNNDKKAVLYHYTSRLGVDVGEVKTIIHAVTVKGYKYITGVEGKLVYSVEWCRNTVTYPLQTVIDNIKVAPVATAKIFKTIEEAFPVGDPVFIIMGLYYGSVAEITDASEVIKSGRIKVMLTTSPEPAITIPEAMAVSMYQPARAAAAKCGISASLFGRITASIGVSPKEKKTQGTRKTDKWIDIGLNVKSTKNDEKLVGFTHNDYKSWQYSARCVELVSNYISKFYVMFQRLESLDSFPIPETELFPNGEHTLSEITEWLDAQVHKKYPWRSCSAIGLDPEEMQALHEEIDAQTDEIKCQESKLGLKVKPHVLFKAELRKGNVAADPAITSFDLYDRVVNINPNSSIPFGAKGTVISISNKKYNNSVKISEDVTQDPIYQVQFDKPFTSAQKVEGVEGARFYMVHGFNLLNITLGCSTHTKSSKKVQINNTVSTQNQIKNMNNLRKNDGHNSAFASYTSTSPSNVGYDKSPVTFNPPKEKERKSSAKGKDTNKMIESPKFNSTELPFVMNPNMPLPNTQFPPTFLPPFSSNNMFNMSGELSPQIMPNIASNGTDLLKSLLKIENTSSPIQPRNSNTENIRDTIFPPNNKLMQGAAENQQFYKTPPNKAQLPFPVKLIHNSAPPQTKKMEQNINRRTSANFVTTQFVPMQVTKKSIGIDVNAPKSFTTQNQPVYEHQNVIVDPNYKPVEVQSQHPPQNSNNLMKTPNNKKANKKSRIAANFHNAP